MMITHMRNMNFEHVEINQWLREFPTSAKCRTIPTESDGFDMC